ncbi:MAG: histidine kinase dimerization/phospho-acceptor domain-containing protein, partial [bacterium]
MAGGIAHKFNNLLTGILGNASLALMDLPPESSARDCVKFIEKSALQAAELTNQMLAYAGKGKYVIETLNLSKLVGEMSGLLETIVPKKVHIEYDLEHDLPNIEADSNQM